jgi:hypothetical protein
MDFLNSRAALVFLLAIIAVAAFVYYSKPEHQSTGMGQALQRFNYSIQNPGQNPDGQRPIKTEDLGDKLKDLLHE